MWIIQKILTLFNKPKPAKTRTYFQAIGNEGIEVDQENRSLKGVKVISKGEALGHEMFIDEEFLNQVLLQGQAFGEKGIDLYWTHGNPLSDRHGDFMGFLNNFRLEEDSVKADLLIDDVAMKDKAEHTLALANKYPDKLGISIEFTQNEKSEDEFMNANKNEEDNFVSPDSTNTNNYRHARLDELFSAAIVAEPAANKGLFSEIVKNNGLSQIEATEVEINNEDDKLSKFKELKELVGDRHDLLVKFYEKGLSVEQAQAELDKLKYEELETKYNEALAKIEALQKELNKSGEEEPVSPTPDNASNEKDFMALVDEMVELKKIRRYEAMSIVSKQHPEVYAKYVNRSK